MAPSYDTQSLFDVKDLVAVISGGGSGIGEVIAHTLAGNGAKAVFILGRREEALIKARDSSPNPQTVHPIVCDVTSKDSLAAAADTVCKKTGYCDVVFANSGTATALCTEGVSQIGKASIKAVQEKLWEPNIDEYEKTFRVNVAGAYYTVVAFLDLLDEGNKRAVVPQKSQAILTGSIAGLTRVPSAGFAYGPSKAAVLHMAKQLATALSPVKIRVNTIVPGIYPSELAGASILKDFSDPRKEGGMPKDLVPLERSGREEELAGIALFLSSKSGGYLNGNMLVTDGGRTGIQPATY
ncbi:hypothetical protein HIM_07824 [Hirsutella minnesotensis 3608]|uniref:Uncharacterized protein n=1 Tax=Hirsutella minnesotensis 3608 TaxID=1043627 RepID=A0A0F8A407_9HYPO|nr:hypothetical protein HIM_07824 [Hirsutella minnesotensis 3608]